MQAGNTFQLENNAFSGGLHDLLGLLVDLTESLGQEYATHSEKLFGIRDRLDAGRIHIAVLGQFKRGKSSLLNALLGGNVLPSSVIPLTSIPTYIRFGSEPYARVHFRNGRRDESLLSGVPDELRAFLSRYVSEEENSGNRMEVEGVELLYNSPLLRRGVVLIDTPGIGSTHLHNTEATLNFLPQCDAALFLVSADPPVTEVEIEFLGQVRKKIDRIYFILNKMDYLSVEECREVMSFILKELRVKAGITDEVELIPLSARMALDAVRRNDSVARERSGIDYLTGRLAVFMEQEKQAVLNAALMRKSDDILYDADMQIRLQLKAHRIPAELLGQKMSLFDDKISEAQRQKVLSADILEGERKRLLHLLEEQSETLRKKSRQKLESILNDFFSRDVGVTENEVREAFSVAIPVLFEHELGEVSRLFDGRVAEIISLHRRRADDIIDSVRRSASDIFEIPHHAHESEEGIRFVREPYWVLHDWKSSLIPRPDDLIEKLMPRRLRERRVRKRLEEQIKSLSLNNVENLRWATLQNLDLTFRKFMSDLDERFAEIIGVTREAIGAAYEKRKNYADQAVGEIERLEELISRMDDMKTRMDILRKSLDKPAGHPQ